ncbi:hypothetical protein [Acinetobacter rathckeae]|uniref:hypothetical protein n=1 Tax=Acinetobacter rathckeae TaxID=2605272 RepID=UPI0018A2A3C9|nr:hypothetical protein [Acinetobacter rathckeae]MBF7688956.1 hypothetical protein [Acinetobacter rathckeae]MBF7696355.1 hypothetical protein [Acinetobacter rathckeae]
MQQNDTQGTEAIRAMKTLRQCWENNEEIYINKGCLHCGSAATYLIYFTNRDIQNTMLHFIEKYNCNRVDRFDLLDIEHFASDYERVLVQLEQHIQDYAQGCMQKPRHICFEEVSSIFERELNMAC